MGNQFDIWVLIIFLAIAVLLDLALRWLAFGRIESVAIDIAIFSMLYSLINYLSEAFRKGDNILEWGIKFILGLLLVLGLSATHLHLKNELREKIEKVFEDLQNKLENAGRKDRIPDLHALAIYAIDVALVARKPGKKKRRARILHAIKRLELDPTGILSDESFLLDLKLRKLIIIIFIIAGLIAVLIPIFPWGF